MLWCACQCYLNRNYGLKFGGILESSHSRRWIRHTTVRRDNETQPKPMVNIGDRPIIWHIMKIFEHHGISEFVICCGYKGYVLKEYFANYYLHNSDFTIDLADASIDIISRKSENWKIAWLTRGWTLRPVDA